MQTRDRLTIQMRESFVVRRILNENSIIDLGQRIWLTFLTEWILVTRITLAESAIVHLTRFAFHAMRIENILQLRNLFLFQKCKSGTM